MHARSEWGSQYLYLSTPETLAFPVNIRDGAGNLKATVMVSNNQPVRYGGLGNSNDSEAMVTEDLLHQPLQGKGLVIDGPKKFYAYYRVHSNSMFHAGDLTCKGRAALGKVFRLGHLLQEIDDGDRRANFVGIMATEDDTEISLSDFRPQTDFRIGGANVSVTGPVTLTLQKGESAVFAQYITGSSISQPPNGLIGALLQATKPVAVNCGSWVGAPVMFQANDIGIDQIAPLEQTGLEYILCRGNGSSILERPIVVAHSDNTKVFLNGIANPAATLQAGEYYAVPTSFYSPAGNLYIRTTEPVFLYQMIGGTSEGDDAMRTAGLIFVPPISCGIPNAVDNIYQPNLIGNMRFDGGLMIVAMKDSAVTVRIDGTLAPIGAPADVPGSSDFVTYRNLNLFSLAITPNTVSIIAEGAVQVAMFGRNQPASFAAFYSGFTKIAKPDIQVVLTGDGVCPDTLVASGHFDGVQWMYGDSILQYGLDTFLVVYTPGLFTAIGYLGVCRRNDFAADTVTASFVSPEFPYSAIEPSCYGWSDGQILFGDPYGGFAPYEFSIDAGKHFSQAHAFDGIAAGAYDLVVRDSKGCYNRPLNISVDQPDSLVVDIVPLLLPHPLKSGEQVELEAVPGRPVVSATWAPGDSSGCVDCLYYTLHPLENTWVSVIVYDPEGCSAVDSLLLAVEPNVYAPNVFSPFSGAGNDHFTLFSRYELPIRRLSIFDRWGDQVFERTDFFTNNPVDGWDGYFRGKMALPGVYAFRAEVEIVPGKTVVLFGDVLLYR